MAFKMPSRKVLGSSVSSEEKAKGMPASARRGRVLRINLFLGLLPLRLALLGVEARERGFEGHGDQDPGLGFFQLGDDLRCLVAQVADEEVEPELRRRGQRPADIVLVTAEEDDRLFAGHMVGENLELGVVIRPVDPFHVFIPAVPARIVEHGILQDLFEVSVEAHQGIGIGHEAGRARSRSRGRRP